MSLSIVEADAKPVLLGHIAVVPWTFERSLFGHHCQQFMLEMDFAQVLQVLPQALGLDGAHFAIVDSVAVGRNLGVYAVVRSPTW